MLGGIKLIVGVPFVSKTFNGLEIYVLAQSGFLRQ